MHFCFKVSFMILYQTAKIALISYFTPFYIIDSIQWIVKVEQGECNRDLDDDKAVFSGTELIALLSSKFPLDVKVQADIVWVQSQSCGRLMELLQAMHQYDITDYNL